MPPGACNGGETGELGSLETKTSRVSSRIHRNASRTGTLRRILANPFGNVSGNRIAYASSAFREERPRGLGIARADSRKSGEKSAHGRKNVTAAVAGSSIGERSSGARVRAAKLFAALGYGVGLLSMCAAAPAAHAQNLAPTRTIVVGGVQPGTVEPDRLRHRHVAAIRRRRRVKTLLRALPSQRYNWSIRRSRRSKPDRR